MRIVVPKVYLLFLSSIFACSLCGCSTASPHNLYRATITPGDSEDILVIAVADATASLDPVRAFENISSMIHKATYDTLVTFPADSVDRIIPALAESWEVSEDDLVYTFKLTDDALFSDGTSVTADDVVFSLNRLKHVAGNPSFLAETIESVEALDSWTVKMTLTRPDPAILAKLVFGAFSIVNREQATVHGATDGRDGVAKDTAEQWLNQNSAGSGSYRLTSWEPGVEVILERNEQYWSEPAAIGQIIIRNVPNAAAQKLQLEAGDIDIALDLAPEQIPALEDNVDIMVHETLSDMLVYLKGNMDPAIGGPASDPLVMKAVRYALDYEGLRMLAGNRSATPASMLPIGFLGAYGANMGIQQDLSYAKALLQKGGYRDGLSLELVYPDLTYAGVNFGTFAQKIQADLAQAGINIALAPTEVNVALESYRQGKEPFGLWIRLSDYRDSVNYLEFLPSGVVGHRINWTEDNADSTILALRDRLRTDTDDEIRAELFIQMQEYLMEQGLYAAILQPSVQIGLRNDVDGFFYHPQWNIDLALLDK